MLDTNVLASGFANRRGPPGVLIAAWRRGAFELVASEHIEELSEAFEDRYFKKKLTRRRANLEIGSPFALPLAVSPDGRHLLIVVAGSATEIHVYRTADGAGGRIATLPKGSQSISWVP